MSADARVSWQLPTIHEAAMVLMALSRLGAVQNPIIPILRQREVSFIVGQTDADLLITPSTWRNFDYGTMARSVAAQQGCSNLEIERGRLPKGDPTTLPPPPDGSGAPVRFIYYTSGTTADPKGVKHTDETVMFAATALVLMSDCHEVVPVTYPFSHIGGVAQMVASLYTGRGSSCTRNSIPYEVRSIWRHRVQPSWVAHCCRFRPTRTPNGRTGKSLCFRTFGTLLRGAPRNHPTCSTNLKASFGVPTLSSWGLTEFPMATVSFVEDLDEDLAIAEGCILPSADLKVVDPEGTTLGPEHEGELLIRGPQLFKGYVDDTLDPDAFDADGYFRTGDVGTVDTRGHVRITGRIKDVIIRNAENLSALEIENAVRRHPKVADVAVIGIPDRVTGERALAVIVLADDVTDLSLPELAEHCRSENLANQKIPERLEIVDELPRNSMGKVVKQELRKRFA